MRNKQQCGILFLMKPVRVGTTIPKQQHEALLRIAENTKSTVGAILAHGAKLAIRELASNPRAAKALPMDGRRVSA